jgi:hypothetical protein
LAFLVQHLASAWQLLSVILLLGIKPGSRHFHLLRDCAPSTMLTGAPGLQESSPL